MGVGTYEFMPDVVVFCKAPGCTEKATHIPRWKGKHATRKAVRPICVEMADIRT